MHRTRAPPTRMATRGRTCAGRARVWQAARTESGVHIAGSERGTFGRWIRNRSIAV